MAIGKINSYATLQPNQGDPIGRAMGIVEDNAFKYRQEDEAKKLKAQQEKEAKEREIDSLKGDFNPNVSGWSGVDDPIYDFAMKSVDKVAELQKQLRNNPNMSYSERAEIKRKSDRYNQSFKYLNQFGPMLKNKVQEIEKGIKEGKYYKGDLDRIEKKLKQFESGKYELNIDENGVPKIKIYETDENGSPLYVIEETGLGDFVNGLNPRKDFDYEKMLNETTKGIKGFTSGTQRGAVINEKTSITPEIRKSAESFAQYVMNDPDTRSIMEEKSGLTGEQLKDKVVTDYLNKIEQKDVQKLDSAYSNLAFRKSVQEQKTKVNFTKVDIPKAIRDSGAKVNDGFTAISVSSNVKPIDYAGGVSLPKISTYTVTTDSFGKPGIYAELIYPDIKTSTLSQKEKDIFSKFENDDELSSEEELILSKITKGAEYKTKPVKLTDSEASKFAMNMGLNSIEEMVELAKGTPKQKTDIEIWNEAYREKSKSGSKQKQSGSYDDL